MKITVDDKAGFCPGVINAISIVEKNLKNNKSISALGSLIHNQKEIDRLKNLGLNEIDQNLLEDNKIDWDRVRKDELLIRSHGLSPELLNRIEQHDIKYIDATCPRVAHSQKIIQQYHKKAYTIVIVGKVHHPEVKALMGFCDNKGIVVLNKGDEKKIKYKKKLLLVAQTTINEERFEYFAKELMKGVDELVVKNTICSIVKNRHEQVANLARKNDVIIFVAGKNSSNSQVLFEKSKQHNLNSFFISSPDELKSQWFKNIKTIGITGGASTPRWQLDEVKMKIENEY